MCEVFAMNGTALRRVNEELKEFYSHSDKHPNGWGLALLEPDMTNWEKEPLCANESRYLRERLSEPIMARSVMAHIRYATIGNVEWRNCHPFCGRDRSGRQWVFQHNGTIFDYPPLHPYVNVQQGDTDSERILLYFLDRIDRKMEESGHVLSKEERFRLLDGIVCDMAHGNKLNLVFFDGELLYVHTNCRGTLHIRQEDGCVMFSTQPLSAGEWEPLAFMQLLAYENGQPAFAGTKHDGEYVEDPEAVGQLYLAYSGL